MVGRKNSLSHPRGLRGHLLPELQSPIPSLLFSLSAFLSSLETPPPQRQSFSAVSRRGPQGPSSKTGVGQ